MRHLCDETDKMLLTPRDTMIVTQATAANDSFPAPHGDQADEEAIFSGLGEVRSARRLTNKHGTRVLSRGLNKQRRMAVPTGGRAHAGFLPGLFGDDDMAGLGEVRSARRLTNKHGTRVLSRGLNKQRRLAIPSGGRSHAGFIPGLSGYDDADGDNLDGLGAAPARLKARVHVHRAAAAEPHQVRKVRTPRANAGFMPGMGDLGIAGMGVGTLVAIGLGVCFLLRKRR